MFSTTSCPRESPALSLPLLEACEGLGSKAMKLPLLLLAQEEKQQPKSDQRDSEDLIARTKEKKVRLAHD